MGFGCRRECTIAAAADRRRHTLPHQGVTEAFERVVPEAQSPALTRRRRSHDPPSVFFNR
jgi:hypothetical protein